ncbi:unnamed protein product [Mesocestoides corti]|uniref:Uncharacterized protein n=1 Tax=Mesocestoides corti TaxID=53468 RepID=A0A0R3URB6_MESCO|nr:unnamed protein product [Mesocestoides corti]
MGLWTASGYGFYGPSRSASKSEDFDVPHNYTQTRLSLRSCAFSVELMRNHNGSESVTTVPVDNTSNNVLLFSVTPSSRFLRVQLSAQRETLRHL